MSKCWETGMDCWAGFSWRQIIGFSALVLFEFFCSDIEMAKDDEATQRNTCLCYEPAQSFKSYSGPLLYISRPPEARPFSVITPRIWNIWSPG